MFSLKQIEDAVGSLLDGRFSGMFSFPEEQLADCAVQVLKAVSKDDLRRIRKETELILRAREDLFVSRGKVYPKQQFFNGAEFRVTPSPAELQKAVLFPGAAFIPFCTEEIFPDEFTLRGENGERLGTVPVTASHAELAPAFLMLGHSGLIDYLSAESEENRQILRGAGNLESVSGLRITAFDMAAYFREHQFKQGDALIFRVDDWRGAKFSFRLQRAAETPDEQAKEGFVRDFESALLRVCETEQDYLSIPLQIAEAYLFAYEDGRDLRTRPVLSLAEYYYRMSEIAIKRDGSEWLLVPSDELDTPGQFEQSLLQARHRHEHEHENGHCGCHDHHHDDARDEHGIDPKSGLSFDADISPEKFSASTGTLESIDAILEELNAPVNSIELGALIYDAMSNGEENFEGFRARIMDFLNLTFADDAQETAFINFLEDNWEISKEYFSPAEDAARAPLRTRLIDLMNERIEYSRALLRRYGDSPVPKELAARVASVHRAMLDTLALLNGDSRLDDSQYEQLELRIGDIEDMWEDLTDAGE